MESDVVYMRHTSVLYVQRLRKAWSGQGRWVFRISSRSTTVNSRQQLASYFDIVLYFFSSTGKSNFLNLDGAESCGFMLKVGWRFSVAVMRWTRSTQLIYTLSPISKIHGD